jgi:hypothetical protein
MALTFDTGCRYGYGNAKRGADDPGLHYGVLGSLIVCLFMVGSLTVIWMLFALSILGVFGIVGIVFIVPALLFFCAPFWGLSVCCPRCRYIWVMSLAEHQRKMRGNYVPPHVVVMDEVLKNGEAIPWK